MNRFDGPESKTADDTRLNSQHKRIKHCMGDSQWRTLDEIAYETGDPTSSVSAQLRHLRKEKFGSYIVERRAKKDRSMGLFEYRVLLPTKKQLDLFSAP